MSTTADAWDPSQYARFRDERSAPFFDLLRLLRAVDSPRVVDLGCGGGELTRELHRSLGAAETVGIDSSAAMLATSAAHVEKGLRFERGDIAAFQPDEPFDIVFSNAALQWVDDHPALLSRLAEAVMPGGQIAIQVPANHDHPSHGVADEVARELPFRTALEGYVRQVPVLPIEAYAELLDNLGFDEQHVRMQVYVHRLVSREDVVEWARGTLLTDYQRRLEPDRFEAYLARYRESLRPRLRASEPYFYPFKRILMWGRRSGP